MSEWVADNTMLVLLGIAFIMAAGWGVACLLRSRWLDDYGNPRE